MIFNEQNILFELNNIFEINQNTQTIKYTTKDCVIALRLDCDMQVIHDNKTYNFNGQCINYFPKDITFEKMCKKNKMIIFHFNTINYFDTKIRVITLNDYTKIIELAKKASSIWASKQNAYKLKATSYFYQIIALICEQIEHTKSDDLLIEPLNYIHSNYRSNEFNLSALPKMVNISEVYFRKIFKKTFGMTAKQYLDKLRINYACTLLQSGYYRVSEIAYMSGFNDEKYFSTTFKKFTNTSPSKFAKLN